MSLAIFLFWLAAGWDLIFGLLFQIPQLKKPAGRVPPSQGTAPLPKISIIFSARNEEKKIAQALTSMLHQNYPDYEVIAIDDRSADKTRSILESMSSSGKYPHFQWIPIESLPAGWLGKTHGLYQGYLMSRGDWLLFTDADLCMDPETLTSALESAARRRLDHLTVWPKIVTRGLFEAFFIHTFAFFFNLKFRPWAAQHARSRAYAGIGSFNFIRRDVYQKIGTHRAIALEVADDMMLGKKVKRAGFRQMLMDGSRLAAERWIEGFSEAMRIFDKNAFAGIDYNLGLLICATAGLIFFDFLPFFLIFFTGGIAFFLTAMTLGILFLTHAAGARYHLLSLFFFPLHPLGTLLMLYIVWRSAVAITARGGVQWRETFYPLAVLKRGKM